MYYITDEQMIQIEELKKQGKYDEALDKVNQFLMKDPINKEALLQIADIQYLKGELDKAEKPIDFLIKHDGEDYMSLYVKGVIEMDKANWSQAKFYLKKAVEMSNFENPEILRCYGVCEYWMGNREKGIDFIKRAFDINSNDAEIIYNLVEFNLLEKNYKQSKEYLLHYKKNYKNLETFGNDISYYDKKMNFFEQYLISINN